MTRPAAAPEREGLRQAMAWLHTWSGLVLGWLMFAIFLTGSLSFYRQEISLWMRPELQAGYSPGQPPSAQALQAAQRTAAQAAQWSLHLPDERDPTLTLQWRPSGEQQRPQTLRLHPQTGEVLTPRETMGGDFFYRFHFELRTAQNGRWVLQGRWVVGMATLLMFIALLSGIVTHRRIFKDFFTLRPGKNAQRAWLDAHNLSGVLVLPFYLMITFSGLMIFHSLYLPAGIAAAYPGPSGNDAAHYFAQLRGEPTDLRQRTERGTPAQPLGELNLAHWLAASTQRSTHPIALLQAYRNPQGQPMVEAVVTDHARLQYRPERLVWDLRSGTLAHHLDAAGPAVRTYGVLYGLHMARFAGSGLRALLLLLGLLGCLMIATGLVLWTVKRSTRAQAGARRGATPPATPAFRPWGERLVAATNMAALGGLPLACAAYLAANRLLPTQWPDRPDAELACFFAAWGLALAWALGSRLLRPQRWGWPVLMGLAGALWAALPLISAFTTPAHLGHTLAQGAWPWALADLAFACTGLALLGVAHKLRPRPAAAAQCAPRTQGADLPPAPSAAPGG